MHPMVTVCHHAANFQRAMAKDIRMQEANSSDYVHGDVDSHELLQFHARNEARDDEECVSLPLENVLRGPGHVAWKLIQDMKENPDSNFVFNDAHILCIPLQV